MRFFAILQLDIFQVNYITGLTASQIGKNVDNVFISVVSSSKCPLSVLSYFALNIRFLITMKIKFKLTIKLMVLRNALISLKECDAMMTTCSWAITAIDRGE